MKLKSTLRRLALAALLLSTLVHPFSTCAQGTAFTYQGQLLNGTNAANGSYSFAFSLYNTNTGGSVIGTPVTNTGVGVTNGLFTVLVDFGPNVFTGASNWLQIAVATNGSGSFTNLMPRQQVTPTPYALFAPNAGIAASANLVAGSNIVGAITGTFSGNGSGLTNLNGADLMAGSVGTTQLANGALAVPSLVPATNVTATPNTSYLITNLAGTAVLLPTNANVGDLVQITGAAGAGQWTAEGLGWTQTSAPSGVWQSVASSSDGTRLAAAAWNGGIYNSTNAGLTWSQTLASNVQWDSVASSSDGTHLVAAVDGGGIYNSTNAGATWAQTPATPEDWLSVASSSNGTRLVAVAWGVGIYDSTNAGATWTQTTATNASWWSVASSSDGTHLVAVVNGGGIYNSTNSGATWTQTTATNAGWESVASSPDGTHLVAAADGGVIYISTNSGAIWTQTTAPNKYWQSVASSSDGTHLVAVANGGGIYSSTNAGATWFQTTAPNETWLSVASSSDGSRLVAVVEGGGIYNYPNLATLSSGGQGATVSLQYLGDGQWAPETLSPSSLPANAAVLNASAQNFSGQNTFSGSVGIGTTYPSSLLTVYGNANPAISLIGSSYNGELDFGIAAGYGNFSSSAAPNDAVIRQSGKGKLLLQTGTGLAAITISTNDYVGIGTSTPRHELDVDGNIFFGKQRNGAVFNEIGDTLYLGAEQKYLGNTLLSPVNGSTDWINLMANPISAGIMFGLAGPAANPHTNITPLMVIQANGNVGIGTVNPSSMLTVNGFGSPAISLIGNGNSAGGQLDFGIAGFGSAYSDSAGPSDAVIRQSGTGNLFLQTGSGFAAIAITPNNYVGIGTATPANELEVQGSADFTGSVGIGTATPGVALQVAGQIESSGPLAGVYFLNQNSSADIWEWLATPGGASLYNSTYGGKPLTVQTNGSIGIGTTTPVTTLEVNGNAQIDGTITAGSFSGNGGGLTNLNATNVSGTIALANLPPTVLTNDDASVTIGGSNSVAPLTVPPTVPASFIGSVGTGSKPNSVAVSGRYAYVANFGSNTLQVIDVSTPSTPVIVGSVSTGTGPFSVAVAGRYAYVANITSNTLQVIDVSTPAAPIVVGSATTAGMARSIAVAGRYAYVVNYGNSTLQVFDVSTPSSPVSVGSVSTGSNSGPYTVAVAGRYAYVANLLGSLQLIDVSAPSAPVSVGSVGIGIGPVSVAVAGRYAYVANFDSNALQVIDVSTPLAPVVVGSVSTGSNSGPWSVAVAGRYAYVANDTSDTLQVIDVSTPSAPAVVGSANTGGAPQSIAVSGRYAYVANYASNVLQVFDLGGAYVQQFEAGTIETGTLQTRDTVTVGNNLDVRGGLTVSASARISGGLSVDNGSITASNFSGTFSGSGAGLTNLNAANITGTFAGNGSGLTNLNASQLTNGTVPDGVLSANVALLNRNPQNFTGTNTFAGSVGIGTTTPTESLTIAGVGSYNSGLKLTGNNVAGTGMALENTSAGGHKYDLISSASGDIEGAGYFAVYDETSNSIRMAISPGGNVGIGTTTPQAQLDVNGSFRINQGTVFNRVQDGIFTAGQSGTNYNLIGTNTFYTKEVTNAFPVAFNSVPSVTVSAVSQAGTDYQDVYCLTVRKVTTTNLVVNIQRVDATTGWAQQLQVSYHAWQ